MGRKLHSMKKWCIMRVHGSSFYRRLQNTKGQRCTWFCGGGFFFVPGFESLFSFSFLFFFQVEILIHLWTAWTQCISLRSEGRLSLSCRFFFCLKVQGSFDGKHQKKTLQAAFLNLAEGHQQEKQQPHILLLGNLEWHCWLRKRQQRHTLKQGIKLSIEILVLVSVACFLYSELKKN